VFLTLWEFNIKKSSRLSSSSGLPCVRFPYALYYLAKIFLEYVTSLMPFWSYMVYAKAFLSQTTVFTTMLVDKGWVWLLIRSSRVTGIFQWSSWLLSVVCRRRVVMCANFLQAFLYFRNLIALITSVRDGEALLMYLPRFWIWPSFCYYLAVVTSTRCLLGVTEA
jgi:hypothetical protein